MIHTIESLLARTEEEGDCHIWTGYYGNGVPMVMRDERMVAVRKVLYELMGKQRRDSGYYTTTCGNKGCVNPDHIVHRANRDFMVRMAKKPFTKERVLRMTQARRKRDDIVLSVDAAREIRLADGKYDEIGARYGVTKTVVSRIKRGMYWPEINSPWAGLMR